MIDASACNCVATMLSSNTHQVLFEKLCVPCFPFCNSWPSLQSTPQTQLWYQHSSCPHVSLDFITSLTCLLIASHCYCCGVMSVCLSLQLSSSLPRTQPLDTGKWPLELVPPGSSIQRHRSCVVVCPVLPCDCCSLSDAPGCCSGGSHSVCRNAYTFLFLSSSLSNTAT